MPTRSFVETARARYHLDWMSTRQKPKPSEVVTERIEILTPEEVAAETEKRKRENLEPPTPPPKND